MCCAIMPTNSAPQRDGAEAFILDLRNNPGGMVSSAMEIAALWVDGPAPVFNVEVRGGKAGGLFVALYSVRAGGPGGG